MFWQKKEHINWPLVIFGILLIVVIVASIGLVVSFGSKVKNGSFGTQFDGHVPAEVRTPGEITDMYVAELTALRDSVQSGDVGDEILFEKTQGLLLEVRVPQHMLDQHLDAFLRFQDPAFAEQQDVRIEVIALLSELIESA